MDLLQLVGSLNKVGIVFFILSVGALIYEIRSFRKDADSTQTTLSIPDFDPSHPTPLPTPTTPIPQLVPKPSKKPSKLPIIIAICALVFFGAVTVVGFYLNSRGNSSTTTIVSTTPTPVVVRTLKSTGIRVYDLNWRQLTQTDLELLSAGTAVYLGVETIPSADIDRARIRVNQSDWTAAEETGEFNQEENVYYLQYTLPADINKFTIEAQLHSASAGWPTDTIYETP